MSTVVPLPAAAPAHADADGKARDEASWAAARFGIFLAGFSAFLGVYVTQPLLPMLQRIFAVSKAEAALTVSAPTVAVALAAPFAGAIGARLGHRRVIVGSLFLLSVPTLLAATATSMPALVAWRFAQGLMVPGIYVVTVALIAEEWPADGVGKATAAFVAGNVVGGFTGRLVAGLVAERGGWRAVFVVLGVLTVLTSYAAKRALPRAGAPRRTPVRRGLGLGLLVEEPRLLATCAVGFNVLFTQVAVFTYVTFYLAAPPFQLGPAAISGIFVVYLVGAVVTPIAGRWIDRVGSRRAVSTALGAAVLGGLLTLAHRLGWVELGLAATCTAVFVSQSASTAFLRVVAPAGARSAASGLYVSSYYLGGAVGGVLPAVAWHLGGWPACVALVAALQLATIALAWRFWRPARAVERAASLAA
jgi:predicted MFS family arabinose efflux permease